MTAVEAGAEDISTDEDIFEVITEPADFTRVCKALEEAGVEIENGELLQRPKSLVPIEHLGQVEKIMRLIDSLEENDDVDAVYANFDAPAEMLDQIAG
jgi:transcriptional/translational regulatory protein YebC/TACO1